MARTIAVAVVARAEADELVRERRDDRHEHDPRQEEERQRDAGARDEAEEEDADDDHDEEEGRAASRVGGAERVDLLGRQRPIGLVGADRLVLGAVIGEDPPDVAHEPDRARCRR